MRRLIGFALLCAAIGMLVMLMIPSTSLLRIIVFFSCLAAGYMLFCN